MAGFSIHFIRGFSLITWKMKFGLRASDGEIIQTPHPWVVGLPPLFPKISKICLLIFVPDRRVWLLLSTQRSEPNQQKQGNRLTRHPCKGDEFEIRILKAQRQNTGICMYLQDLWKKAANMDIHFDWQPCDSRVKICVSPARWCDFCVQGLTKNIVIFFETIDHLHHVQQSSMILLCFFFLTLHCHSAAGKADETVYDKGTLWRHVQLYAQVFSFEPMPEA